MSLDPPRDRLLECDRLLEELEQLNLHEQHSLPVRLGTRLEQAGVEDPYDASISELIEKVFELQEPALKLVHADRRSHS